MPSLSQHCFEIQGKDSAADKSASLFPNIGVTHAVFPPSRHQALGQVECSVLMGEVESFAAAYQQQRQAFSKINAGGNGLYHSFGIWVTLRLLKPRVIIESGVLNGQTSWLMRQATKAWQPLLLRFDPGSIKKPPWRDTLSGLTLDFIGPDFVDFNTVPWNCNLTEANIAWRNVSRKLAQRATGLLASAPPISEWLVFFDDHHDHLLRASQARAFGFRHLLYDDNYLPGFGDSFSLKAACNGGNPRRAFANRNRPFRRCVSFHKQCHVMDEDEAARARTEFAELIEAYWEPPPLGPLHVPAAAAATAGWTGQQRAFGQLLRVAKWAEGPRVDAFTEEQKALMLAASRPPLFESYVAAANASGTSLAEVVHEAGNYVNLAYARLRLGPPALERKRIRLNSHHQAVMATLKELNSADGEALVTQSLCHHAIVPQLGGRGTVSKAAVRAYDHHARGGNLRQVR